MSSTMNPSYIDENIKKVLKRAKKIAQDLELYELNSKQQVHVSPDTVVGIAAMIQLEVMNAPLIIMNAPEISGASGGDQGGSYGSGGNKNNEN